MIVFDLINLQKIRRAILYILCILVTVLLQNCVFSRISPLGVKAMIVPVTVAAIGLFEGGMWGGMLGLFCGLLCDLAAAGTSVVYSIVFTITGFCSGLMGDKFINKKLYSYIILAVMALIFLAICQTVPLWVFYDASLSRLIVTASLQVLWSVVFAVPAYFACRGISRFGGSGQGEAQERINNG